MKKELIIVMALAVVIIILLGVLVFFKMPPKESRLVLGGDSDLIITSINESVDAQKGFSSPLKMYGEVSGKNSWTGFEGQVGTVTLLDYKGNELGTSVLKATTDWTKPPVKFEAIINFVALSDGPATLVFKNENASGLAERDKIFSLPIKILKTDTTEVTVYFGNQALSATSEQDECKRVYPVKRYVAKTQAVAKAALEELLKGPTDAEKNQGYFSSIPSGSTLNNIVITNGEAKADFNQTIESGGGSCSMAARVAQITQTLKQFSTVSSVKLSIDGRTGDIFQP